MSMRFWSALACILLGGVCALLLYAAFGQPLAWIAYAAGGTAGAGFVLLVILSDATCGEDGRRSASKLQFVMWTAVFAYAFTGFFAKAFAAGRLQLPPQLGDPPMWLLGAIGMSSATLVAAKAITATQVKSGARLETVEERGRANKKGGFFSGDDGDASLTKVQMLFFNALGAAIFLISATKMLGVNAAEMKWPDIDQSILLLSGVGSATYLGRKMVVTSEPTISRIVPAQAGVISIRGVQFGERPGVVLLNAFPYDVAAADWAERSITFRLPANLPRQVTGVAELVRNQVARQVPPEGGVPVPVVPMGAGNVPPLTALAIEVEREDGSVSNRLEYLV